MVNPSLALAEPLLQGAVRFPIRCVSKIPPLLFLIGLGFVWILISVLRTSSRKARPLILSEPAFGMATGSTQYIVQSAWAQFARLRRSVQLASMRQFMHPAGAELFRQIGVNPKSIPSDLEVLSYKDLQALAKQYKIRANAKKDTIKRQLHELRDSFDDIDNAAKHLDALEVLEKELVTGGPGPDVSGADGSDHREAEALGKRQLHGLRKSRRDSDNGTESLDDVFNGLDKTVEARGRSAGEPGSMDNVRKGSGNTNQTRSAEGSEPESADDALGVDNSRVDDPTIDEGDHLEAASDFKQGAGGRFPKKWFASDGSSGRTLHSDKQRVYDPWELELPRVLIASALDLDFRMLMSLRSAGCTEDAGLTGDDAQLWHGDDRS